MNDKYNYAIRDFAEYICRKGNIEKSDSISDIERAYAGSYIHKKLQKQRIADIECYKAEKQLSYTFLHERIELTLSGKCDGFYIKDDTLNVDEIKTLEYEFDQAEPISAHLVQAAIYGYILLKEKEITLNTVAITIIYYNISDNTSVNICKRYTAEELYEIVESLMHTFLALADKKILKRDKLLHDISSLHFPYDSFREGQRKISVAVYKTITAVSKRKVFISAPTGIGKTMAVLFPSVRAMLSDDGIQRYSKIFYFTARTQAANPPHEAYLAIAKQAQSLSVITITAKEKICPFEHKICDYRVCRRALGHYDRVSTALSEAIDKNNDYTREYISALADKYDVCPFELSLDISLWCDMIICDYNYLFDPNAYLRRYFADNSNNYLFLVDEAHNLEDRVRNMYTAYIRKSEYSSLAKNIRKSIKGQKGLKAKYTELLKKTDDIHTFFSSDFLSKDASYPIITEGPNKDLLSKARLFCTEAAHISSLSDISQELNEQFTNLYFDTMFYIKVSEMFDESFTSYFDNDNGMFASLLLADPVSVIKEKLNKAVSSILFSATLLPASFYFSSLGGERDTDAFINVPSPFDPSNSLVISSSDIVTLYKQRSMYYDSICKYITMLKDYSSLDNGKNYMVFFSSYKYLKDIYDRMDKDFCEEYILLQPKSSDPAERDEFLMSFTEDNKKLHIGFCVLGGVFSEGIDLPGRRLSGAIIVGVGLPMVCPIREMIRDIHDKKNKGDGFTKAYIYPGLNKVIQAGGRVIRTESDRGFIILLDERYNSDIYRKNMPPYWYTVYENGYEGVKKKLFDFRT